MAGIDVGGAARGKRAMNAEINMIPFVDLLLVTVAFLLVTAVWVERSRMTANAEVPGQHDTMVTREKLDSVLDVRVGESDITLAWKKGNTVVSERAVPRSADARDLAAAFAREWKEYGGHKSDADTQADQAVIHTDNRLPFKELVAVMDGLYATKRSVAAPDGRRVDAPVFNATFSVR